MKTFLKIIAGLFIICLLVLAGFIYSFDANDYKNELTGIIEKTTGHSVHINGDINISIYPLISIKASQVTIDNKPGFSKHDFASIEQFIIGIKILPLLQNRLDIDKLVLNRLSIDFEKNSAGDDNWSDLDKKSDNTNTGSALAFNGIAIGAIEVIDSSLSWRDTHTGKQFIISKMDLNTDTIINGQPLPVSLKARIRSNLPDWNAAVAIKTQLEFRNDSVVFNANDLKLAANAIFPSSVGKISLALNAKNSQINLQSQTIKLANTQVKTLGLTMTGDFDIENLFSTPMIHGPLEIKPFDAHTLAEQFKITIPVMKKADSLKQVSLTTHFKTDFNSLQMDELSVNTDNSRINGFIQIQNSPELMVRYNLTIDKMRLDDYSPASSAENQTEIPLPVDFIKTVDLEGDLNIETLIIDDIELTKFHSTSNIKNGVINASPLTMLIGESIVNANLQLDTSTTPTGIITIAAENIDAKTTANPWLGTVLGNGILSLEGKINAKADLKINGSSISALKKSASGTVTLDMQNAMLTGIDLDHASRSVVIDYANKNNLRTRASYVANYIPDHETQFNSIHATFTVAPGKLNNNELTLISDQANITGSGHIDTINNKLNYNLTVDINIENPVDIRDKLRDHPMEYRAQGKFKNVSCEFDYQRYDFLVSRMLMIEAKARKIKQMKESAKKTW